MKSEDSGDMTDRAVSLNHLVCCTVQTKMNENDDTLNPVGARTPPSPAGGTAVDTAEIGGVGGQGSRIPKDSMNEKNTKIVNQDGTPPAIGDHETSKVVIRVNDGGLSCGIFEETVISTYCISYGYEEIAMAVNIGIPLTSKHIITAQILPGQNISEGSTEEWEADRVDLRRRLRRQVKRWKALQYCSERLYDVTVRSCDESMYEAITGNEGWRAMNNRKDLYALLAIMKKICTDRQQDANSMTKEGNREEITKTCNDLEETEKSGPLGMRITKPKSEDTSTTWNDYVEEMPADAAARRLCDNEHALARITVLGQTNRTCSEHGGNRQCTNAPGIVEIPYDTRTTGNGESQYDSHQPRGRSALMHNATTITGIRHHETMKELRASNDGNAGPGERLSTSKTDCHMEQNKETGNVVVPCAHPIGRKRINDRSITANDRGRTRTTSYSIDGTLSEFEYKDRLLREELTRLHFNRIQVAKRINGVLGNVHEDIDDHKMLDAFCTQDEGVINPPPGSMQCLFQT